MNSKRRFLKLTVISTALLSSTSYFAKAFAVTGKKQSKKGKAIVVSTWAHGLPANDAAWQVLTKMARPLMRLSKAFVCQRLILM